MKTVYDPWWFSRKIVDVKEFPVKTIRLNISRMVRPVNRKIEMHPK